MKSYTTPLCLAQDVRHPGLHGHCVCAAGLSVTQQRLGHQTSPCVWTPAFR